MRALLTTVLALAAATAAPAAPPDPLRLIPREANLVLKVERPRHLIEAVTTLDAYRGYQDLPQVRAALESTAARRFFQLLAHAEAKLGAKWPALLDAVAGGGIALGAVAGQDQGPVLVAVQGTDEAKTAAAFRLLVQLLTDELARQSTPDKPVRAETGTHRGADVVHVGEDFFAARLGAVLLVSNKRQAMERGLALATGADGAVSVLERSSVPAAGRLLGGDPLAWLWFDLNAAKKDKGFSDFLETARTQGFLLFTVGGTVDAVRRAEFVTAGLFRTDAGLKLSVKLPARRADLPPEFALHVPTKPGVPGTLPLLEPPGVLYSQSTYLDVGSFWEQRKAILGEQELKDLEKGAADISKLLPGTTFGQLLEMSGPHHRFVAVERGVNQYRTVPEFPLPEMAVVSSMKDPQFGKTMATTLRTAALLASLNLGMTMSEEKVGGVDVVSYRFREDKPLAEDPTNLRFSFVPTFAVVNGYLVVGSSPRLVTDLIPELTKEVDPAACSSAVWRNKVYGGGAAAWLKARPEVSITDAVLSQGIGLDEATKQVDQLARFVGTLGTAAVTADHTADAFVVDVEWNKK